ncbi:hypothetical protein GCM10020254_37390 [Streptomyces goshikiensis]
METLYRLSYWGERGRHYTVARPSPKSFGGTGLRGGPASISDQGREGSRADFGPLFVTGLTTSPPRRRFRIHPEHHAPRSPHPRPTPPAHPPGPAPPPGRRGVHHTGTTIALLREAGTPAPLGSDHAA